MTACRFREARLSVGLGVASCAGLLRVSDRTIRNWESGTVRIPYAAYKLLRVLRGGRYMAHPVWRDYRVWGDVLFTPEGHQFQAGELAWWSLLVRRARAFSDLRHRVESIGAGAPQGRPALGLSLSPSKEKSHPVALPSLPPISRVCDTVPAEGDAPLGKAGVPKFPVPGMAAAAGHPRPLLGGVQ